LLILSFEEIRDASQKLANICIGAGWKRLCPVLRGGAPIAYAMAEMIPGATVVQHPNCADVMIDDIYDSGDTRDKYPNMPFLTIVSKDASFFAPIIATDWVLFPWEEREEKGAADIVTRLLQYIGENPKREGLRETPARFLKAWKEFTCGYGKDPAELFKVFEDGAEGCDEMVVVRDINFYSSCEHHLVPIIGTATVAYVPNGKIVGLSKIARLVDMYARRLQVQERMTTQIADAIEKHLQPMGCGVVITAEHLCMSARGVMKPGSKTVTSALRGVFQEGSVRAEFLSLANTK
jgi:GTP cyclohydrolase I